MSDFKSQLRSQLLDAEVRMAARRQRIRRSVAAALAAALVAVLAALGAGEVFPSVATADPVKIIDQGNGYLMVQITNESASFNDVNAALRREGIDARLEEQPSSPRQIGHILSMSSGPATNYVPHPDGPDGQLFATFEVPKGAKAPVIAYYGRKAKPGEMWSSSDDAYQDGNLMHCSNLWGKRPEDAKTYAMAHGFSVSFSSGAIGADIVTLASQTSDRTVVVTLNTTPTSPLVGRVDPPAPC